MKKSFYSIFILILTFLINSLNFISISFIYIYIYTYSLLINDSFYTILKFQFIMLIKSKVLIKI